MKKRHGLKVGFALASIFLTPLGASTAQAQIPEAALTAGLSVIGGLTVGKVLDQIQQATSNIGSIANNDFSLDYGNAYITLQAGLQGVWNSLDTERDKLVSNLDDQRKNALLDVYVLSNDLLNKQIPYTQAKLKVDTLQVLNHVRLLGKETLFMVSSINPTVITTKASGDYTITVLGIGIGNQEGHEIPTTITLTPSDGAPIKLTPDNIPDGITFTVPSSAVVGRFTDTGFYKMRVEIASVVDQSCGILDLFHCSKPYSFDYSMTLFPKTAVSGTVAQIKTTPSTDPTTRNAKYVTVTTPNGDNGGHGNMMSWATAPVQPDPGFQIMQVQLYKCDNATNANGNPCAFVYPDNSSLIPQNGGAVAQMKGTNNSFPVTLHFAVWQEKKTTTSVPLPSSPVSFAAGETKPVKVFGDDASALLNVTTATGGQAIIPMIPAGGLATAPVVCTNKTDVGGGLAQFLCTAKGIEYY